MSAPLIASPDHIGAVIARLRSFPELLALCPDETRGPKTIRRIGGAMDPLADPDHWTGHALIVRDAPGGGEDLYVPLSTPRIDLWAYGSTGYEASRAARLALAALVPPSRRGLAFTGAHCRIIDVRRLSGFVPLYDARIQAHVRIVTYELLKSEEPVTA